MQRAEVPPSLISYQSLSLSRFSSPNDLCLLIADRPINLWFVIADQPLSAHRPIDLWSVYSSLTLLSHRRSTSGLSTHP
ncbi:unnamed protein product [Camellia sinensis]